MMKHAFFLFASFVVVSIAMSAGVTSLPYPLTYIPLLHITGLLVLNRLGIAEGVVWILASGIMLSVMGLAPGAFPAAFVMAGLGAILTEKVFATRSAYALLGLGLVTGVSAGCTRLAWEAGTSFVAGRTFAFGQVMQRELWTAALLLMGLYVGYVMVVSLRQRLQKLFVLR